MLEAVTVLKTGISATPHIYSIYLQVIRANSSVCMLSEHHHDVEAFSTVGFTLVGVAFDVATTTPLSGLFVYLAPQTTTLALHFESPKLVVFSEAYTQHYPLSRRVLVD